MKLLLGIFIFGLGLSSAHASSTAINQNEAGQSLKSVEYATVCAVATNKAEAIQLIMQKLNQPTIEVTLDKRTYLFTEVLKAPYRTLGEISFDKGMLPKYGTACVPVQGAR